MDIVPSAFGFAPEVINSPDTITAYVSGFHTYTGRAIASPNPHDADFPPASFGVVYAGQGGGGMLWGYGSASYAAPMPAYGVLEMLKVAPPGVRLVVHAARPLWEYVAPDGHVRYAMRNGGRGRTGRRMPGYQALAAAAVALDEGRWSYVLIHKANKSVPFMSAANLAVTQAVWEGRAHLERHPTAARDAGLNTVFLTGP